MRSSTLPRRANLFGREFAEVSLSASDRVSIMPIRGKHHPRNGSGGGRGAYRARHAKYSRGGYAALLWLLSVFREYCTFPPSYLSSRGAVSIPALEAIKRTDFAPRK